MNELIERHNRNFPAEARLAMDPRTRDFVRINGRSYLREPLDARWILDRFPADRDCRASRLAAVLAVLRGAFDLVHPRLAALDPDLGLRP